MASIITYSGGLDGWKIVNICQGEFPVNPPGYRSEVKKCDRF
ncbi:MULTISPECIES: hypothetical protein [Limnospira]|nr:hypothetical protein [Limnospira sp. PMC 894.15]MDT9191079.1 hypothetical protein [Limnospira sp. PMC 894.15]